MRRLGARQRARAAFTPANVAAAVGSLGFVCLVVLYLVSLVWPTILGTV